MHGRARQSARHLMNKAFTPAWRSDAQLSCARSLLLLRRLGIIPVVAVVSLTFASSVLRPSPLLLWNVSPSSPTGLYLIREQRPIHVEDMIAAWPPRSVRTMADRRHYLPTMVPLIKRVAAVSGDRVCARNRSVVVNGRLAVLRRRRDPNGRLLPWWTGCRHLRRDELLLLSPNRPLAFDGRYFGFTHADEVIGKAELLWAS